MRRIINEIFYPFKNVKVFIIINICFFLVVGLLSISGNIIMNIISTNYDYYEDNVLYDEFTYEEGMYNSLDVDKILYSNSLKYSNLLENDLSFYSCITSMSLRCKRVDNKTLSLSTYFTDYFDLAYAINTGRSTNLTVFDDSSGIYISNIFYEKLNRPKYLRISTDFEKYEGIDVPVVGIFEEEEFSEATDRIYCSYDYIKYFENVEYRFDYNIKGIYVFKENIDKVIDGTKSKFLYVSLEKENYNALYKTLELFFSINIVIFSLILFIVLFQKNNKLKDVKKILNIYYKNNKVISFRYLLYDILLVVFSFIIALIILCVVMLICNGLYGDMIYPDKGYFGIFVLTIGVILSFHVIYNIYYKFIKE